MRHRLAVGAAAALLLTAACGTEAAPDASGTAPLTGRIVVLAAASLTGAFEAIGADFERAHPGVTVAFSFGASSALAQQVRQGVPADVFAAASTATMQQVSDAVVGDTLVFARNGLQIAVPSGNPAGVSGLEDLADESLRIALCAEQVPCGAVAKAALAQAGVTPAPDTLEQDVKATVTKVALGEVDAALVYRTDVLAAQPDVEGIDLPDAVQAGTDYPVAVLTGSRHPLVARAFADFTVSPAARAALTTAGFELS